MNNETAYTLQPKRPLSIDGVRRREEAAQTAAPAYAPQPVKRRYFQPPPTVKKRRFVQKLQLPLLLAAGLSGGFFANSLTAGLTLLSGYAVVAIVRHISSRTTFAMAFLLLAAIAVLLLARPDQQLISNFATYAFALLIIGVITLARESRMPKRSRRYRRR